MKLQNYLKDKIVEIILILVFVFVSTTLLIVFHVQNTFLWIYLVICILFLVPTIMIDYFRKHNFYNELRTNIDHLDKKYLVIDTINRPSFYEGELICDSIYEIDKSMCENVKKHEISINSFKDYIEMWVHEVKIPIASLLLMCHNNSMDIKKYKEQLRRMDFYTDQVLYYVRSENAANDYLIKETELGKIITNAAQKNREDLLENCIELQVRDIRCKVMTDKKWLEFILNQIINNSIKYRSQKRQSGIWIFTEQTEDKVVLHIKDNGIGIMESDLPNVFKKSYTGENGRKHAKSTGMGLYIVKMLCDELGHAVSICSKEDEYTEVMIMFAKNDFYKIEGEEHKE